MWISREAARSDVVLAPAGIVLGGGLISLLEQVPGWPGGLVGGIVALLFTITLMIGWPTWLARQRGEPSATPEPLNLADVGRSVSLSLPVVAAGVAVLALQGLPINRAVFGRFALIPLSADGLVQIALLVVAALGTFLVLALVARRAVEAFRSPEMSLTAGLRTYGLGFAAAATVLQVLLSISASQSLLRGLVVGAALGATVLLADRQVPAGRSVTRAGILAPAVVTAVLWFLQGGFLLGGPLLPRLAFAATSGTLALCIGALVQGGRTWITVLLPLAAAVWLQAVIPPY